MNLTTFRRTTAIVLAAMLALAAWALTRVPLDVEVPIHWGPDGTPDGFASPLVAFLAIPLITLALAGLFELIPRVEPRRANLLRSANAYRTVATGVIVFMAALHAFAVFAGIGVGIPLGVVFGLGTGVMFALIGNVMGTVRSNFMFGVRTPWTLTSELSWYRTHRLVGRLFVVGGVICAIAGVAFGEIALSIAVTGVIVVILVAAFGYSYKVWRDDPDRADAERAS